VSTVLITGASSGFGRAAALAFARRKDTVYGTVRSVQKAESLRQDAAAAGLEIRCPILDVTHPAGFTALVDTVIAETGSVDVLVNNAGVIHPGAFEDLGEARFREVMETNFFGPMLLTRAVLPQMRAQGSGCIIMISSLSGLAGLAGDVAYSASKFALEGATEALRHEVDRWGIRVALVEAGQYATGLFDGKEDLPPDYPADSPYRALVASKLRELREGKTRALSPEVIGELLTRIVDADGSQLRWAADDVARLVLGKTQGLDDAERDAFLRSAGGSDWWSQGLAGPHDAARGQ
jgi:NAD(P)-dependent dehydrogenase (short-subunit alcohol dehydrogenase family)